MDFKTCLDKFYAVKKLTQFEFNDILNLVKGDFKLFFRLDGSNKIKVTRLNNRARVIFIYDDINNEEIVKNEKEFDMLYEEFFTAIKDSLSIWFLEEL